MNIVIHTAFLCGPVLVTVEVDLRCLSSVPYKVVQDMHAQLTVVAPAPPGLSYPPPPPYVANRSEKDCNQWKFEVLFSQWQITFVMVKLNKHL